ncbi:MAG: CoA transferase [Arenimonas sp.]|jgi:crotonobetainyl-CoA:carnitine CoA-transferase CaiB-like acyl-CoA transferase
MSSLAGITVLEFSRVLAGPWCGMQLADLGAEVIKIESFDGDDTRGLGPPFKDGLSAYFACCNRNKKSLAIDLRAPAARALIDALVRSADVVVENYRTGTAEALGVGYDAFAAINPRLVYCSISGYGRSGADAMRPGYDFAIQAEAGLMSITGDAQGDPYKVGVAVADLATGQNAAIAILAALRHRDASGRGQHIDVSLFDTQLSWLANIGSNVLFTGADAPRYGNAHASIVPYQAFHASDGQFVLAVASEKLWSQTCHALDRPDWIDAPDYRNNSARVDHRVALCAELEQIFAAAPVAHWLALFERAGVPAAPINTVKQALDLPLVQDRGMQVELGGVPMIGSPLKLSLTPVVYRDAPPRLGQHSDEIVSRIGGDPAALRAAGVIR